MKKLLLLLLLTWGIIGGCVYYPDHYRADYNADYYYAYPGPSVGLSFYYPYGYYYPRAYYPRQYYYRHDTPWNTRQDYGPYRYVPSRRR